MTFPRHSLRCAQHLLGKEKARVRVGRAPHNWSCRMESLPVVEKAYVRRSSSPHSRKPPELSLRGFRMFANYMASQDGRAAEIASTMSFALSSPQAPRISEAMPRPV